MHWSYCSLALSHWYIYTSKAHLNMVTDTPTLAASELQNIYVEHSGNQWPENMKICCCWVLWTLSGIIFSLKLIIPVNLVWTIHSFESKTNFVSGPCHFLLCLQWIYLYAVKTLHNVIYHNTILYEDWQWQVQDIGETINSWMTPHNLPSYSVFCEYFCEYFYKEVWV